MRDCSRTPWCRRPSRRDARRRFSERFHRAAGEAPRSKQIWRFVSYPCSGTCEMLEYIQAQRLENVAQEMVQVVDLSEGATADPVKTPRLAARSFIAAGADGFEQALPSF